MKNLPYYLFVFTMVGFIIFQAGNNTIEANSEQDLKRMVSILNDEHILVTDWSLYTREVLEDQNAVKELKEKFSDWSWDGTTATHVSPGYEEEIKIVSSAESGQLHTYIMYEVKGQSWDTHSEEFLNKIWPKRKSQIFVGDPETFSCVKGEVSDNMNKSLPVFMNGLLEAFNAEKIEELEEETFISTSAFSPLFSGTLSEDHEMNVQLGLRKPDGLGGNTTLVVGTPIITIEY